MSDAKLRRLTDLPLRVPARSDCGITTAEAEALERLVRRLRELRALGLTMDAIEVATGVTVARIEALLEVQG